MSGPSYQQVLHELAARRRVLLLGGVAIILHGLSRATEDADIWLDPQPVEAWAGEIRSVLAAHPGLIWQRLTVSGWIRADGSTLEEAALSEGFVRLVGADRPIDIFYAPNEIEAREFEAVWERARETPDGLRCLDEIDLLLIKQATFRSKDVPDIVFLEAKIDADYRAKLREADLSDAESLLDRYATPGLLRAVVTEARDSRVRELARAILRRLESDGDPFAAEYLRELEATYSAAPPK